MGPLKQASAWQRFRIRQDVPAETPLKLVPKAQGFCQTEIHHFTLTYGFFAQEAAYLQSNPLHSRYNLFAALAFLAN
jgi:hypothetical protein